ncbi:LOW QUALITY PROTEIN: hypothetical protein MAR_035994 [Mya arenaria]|uniref:DNA-directed DNA polymerase n=1 Tax=Mya arenaria TaxID=6604 RepID=A0ABY7ELQ8_MYAAR|nr:LOW QUALITY PROTEIN: hypothetical protein MAR_035994 [Mya arenaria]
MVNSCLVCDVRVQKHFNRARVSILIAREHWLVHGSLVNKEAVSKGYTIQNIYEVWHFEEVLQQYDQGTKTAGLLTEVVNTFLKVKQESTIHVIDAYAHWPLNVHGLEGILLDYIMIEKSPRLRSLAKLMFISFWGKFRQQTILTQATYIADPADFFEMITSYQRQVKNVRYLKPLGNRVLYCDTDSIVFTIIPGQWKPQLGDYLGDLTDEVPNNAITAFKVPKTMNIPYVNQKQKELTSICQVRGITFNSKNSLHIKFNKVKDMVTGKSADDHIAVVDENKIVRNPTLVITKREVKDYKIVFDKRVITDKNRTQPYAY